MMQQEINTIPIQQGVLNDDHHEDTQKWEIDTAPIMDSFYHELLGETQVEGVWKRDHTLKRYMNEKGASFIKSLMKSRINKITMLSKLDDEFIRQSLLEISQNLSDMLFSFYDEWKIEPRIANLTGIVDMVIDNIHITYLASKDGGIRRYRVDAKGGGTSTMMSPYYGLGNNVAAMMNDNNQNGVM